MRAFARFLFRVVLVGGWRFGGRASRAEYLGLLAFVALVLGAVPWGGFLWLGAIDPTVNLLLLALVGAAATVSLPLLLFLMFMLAMGLGASGPTPNPALAARAALVLACFLMESVYSCMVRRLHDTGRSGLWALCVFLPQLAVLQPVSSLPLGLEFRIAISLLGWIGLLPFLLSPGMGGENRYGPPPP
jgi:uncharacterized membrane protein YhaH (DUF805 family)